MYRIGVVYRFIYMYRFGVVIHIYVCSYICIDLGVCVSWIIIVQSTSTGWRRSIGCLKLLVIFRKKATNHRALLRKMTRKDKASYGSSPPSNASCWGSSTPLLSSAGSPKQNPNLINSPINVCLPVYTSAASSNILVMYMYTSFTGLFCKRDL